MARPVHLWPLIAAIVAAIALEIVPLPAVLQGLRPPLPAMPVSLGELHSGDAFCDECGTSLDKCHNWTGY